MPVLLAAIMPQSRMHIVTPELIVRRFRRCTVRLSSLNYPQITQITLNQDPFNKSPSVLTRFNYSSRGAKFEASGISTSTAATKAEADKYSTPPKYEPVALLKKPTT
jgi:hypothetical protein